MELIRCITKLYPKLEYGKDYRVYEKDAGPYIVWYNETITQPTQAEIDDVWVIVRQEIIKENKLIKIKKQIANTIINYKGGKWKLRKKDIGHLSGYFLYADKKSGEPIDVPDSEYNKVSLTYLEFGELATLLRTKREEIENNINI